MRFDFHNSWLRLVIEFFPRAVPMRRYRVTHADALEARRKIVRHIRQQLRTAPNSS